MNRPANPYKRHRLPPVIIQYAVWLYHRFNLSQRDIEELPASQQRWTTSPTMSVSA